MKVDVFISHHTETSLSIAEAIANKLEFHGIRCWYAPRDTEGDYAGSIIKAIKSCSTFLIILNHNSSYSPHVLNELNAVTQRLANNEKVNIIAFHTADDDISDAAQYYLGRIHWIDAMKPSIFDRINELVTKITVIYDRNISPKSVDSSRHKLISKIPTVRDIFIGREHLLDVIGNFFESNQRILFLEGIGGIGKSEIAKHYAMKYRDRYKNIVFVTYSENLFSLVCDNDKIEITDISIYPDESKEDFFRRKLRVFRSITDKKTLLIVDNYDVDFDKDFEEFTEGSCDIIFTTRNSHPGYSSFKISAIDDTEKILTLFEKYYGMPLSENDRPYIQKLAESVENHTYAMELLAKQMETSFISCKELYEMFCHKSFDNYQNECFAGRDGIDTALGHIRRLFDLSRLDETEKSVLGELSLFGITGVPVNVYLKCISPESLSSKKKALLSLIKKSWVRRTVSEDIQSVSLHPLVAEVIHSDEKARPDTVNCHELLCGLSKYLYKTWYRPIKENLAVMDSILFMEEYFSPFVFDKDDHEIYCIFSYMPTFLWQVGKFDEAIRYGRQFFDTCLSVCSTESMLIGYAAKMVAGCYFNSGRLEESIPWYRKGLEYMLDAGKETEDLAMSYEKVARCYTWPFEQDFDKAEEYFKRSYDIRKKIMDHLGDGKTDETVELYLQYDRKMAEIRIGELYMELGRMYQLKNEYKTALTYAQKYESILLKCDKENLSDIAYAHNDKGICYYHMGLSCQETEPSKADEYFRLALQELSSAHESNMKMRGKLAIDCIDTQEMMGDIYFVMGKNHEAVNCYLSAISMTERLCGYDSKRAESIKSKMKNSRL